MSLYKKFFAQLVATVAAAIIPAIADDNVFSNAEIINIIIVALGAIGVLGAGNLPEGTWKYMKFIVSAASAVAVFASSAITDGSWSNAETLQAVLAALGALGVVALPGPFVQPLTTGRHTAL